jgi:hypothetical protein
MVCGRLPESEMDLASQPTISRLENAPEARSCLRMARALGELYIAERGKEGTPKRVLVDFDATDDPAHGDQEGATTTATTNRRSFTPCWSSTGTPGNSSRHS